MCPEQVRCTDIKLDPRRGSEAPKEIEALAASIRMHRILRPVLLQPTADGYLIVHGERRWRAARAIGLDAVPAYVVQTLDEGSRISA
jgi:ParB family chromosome partitioning protein